MTLGAGALLAFALGGTAAGKGSGTAHAAPPAWLDGEYVVETFTPAATFDPMLRGIVSSQARAARLAVHHGEATVSVPLGTFGTKIDVLPAKDGAVVLVPTSRGAVRLHAHKVDRDHVLVRADDPQIAGTMTLRRAGTGGR